jgi:hypothetical protein
MPWLFWAGIAAIAWVLVGPKKADGKESHDSGHENDSDNGSDRRPSGGDHLPNSANRTGGDGQVGQLNPTPETPPVKSEPEPIVIPVVKSAVENPPEKAS